MRGGALPPALVFAALAFALAWAPPRVIAAALAFAAAVGLLAAFAPVPAGFADSVFLACWVTIVATTLIVYSGRPAGYRLALLLALNTGVWAGAAVAVAGRPLDLTLAAAGLVIVAPCRWLTATRRGIAVKVAASWLIAVALLAATLPAAVATPGYEADHAE